jgi:carbon storage regulator
MLVLTRRQGESIIIGNGIKLTVVSVGPGRVKIGITAPPEVRIDREEIHSRIQQEQSADVLEAVSTEVLARHSAQNTITNSTSDTGILNKRIAENPSDEHNIVSTSLPDDADAKVSKYRLPRKPR